MSMVVQKEDILSKPARVMDLEEMLAIVEKALEIVDEIRRWYADPVVVLELEKELKETFRCKYHSADIFQIARPVLEALASVIESEIEYNEMIEKIWKDP